MRNYYKKLKCLPCRLEEWEPWLWKHIKWLINLHLSVFMILSIWKTLNILSDTTTFWKYHRSNPHGTVNNLSDLLHLHCGTASQIISGLNIAFLNSRVFCSPGMGPNVAVLHVDDYNFAFALLIFFLYFFHFLIICLLCIFFLVWLENCLFFDFLVRQCCFYWLCWC
jgi:hypothetical protein